MPHDQAYYEAEKKIEEALKSGAIVLNLNPGWKVEDNKKLTELPKSVGQLTQLRSLNLSNNQLGGLPESLAQLNQLRSLDISLNKFTTLPLALKQLTKLQSLNLSHNYGLMELPEWITQLEKLEVLNLSHIASDVDENPLSLPDSFGKLRHIKRLDISLNSIKKIPEQIKELNQLQSLNLTHNNIKVIPEWVEQLIELEELLVGYTKIKDIPASLIHIENLERLNLDGAPLNPDLAKAYKQGFDAVKAYLRTKPITTTLDKSTHEYKLKVFLCHASQDKPVVYELYEKLIIEGWIEPWLDAKKLLPGQDWQSEIKNAVEAADNVIIFLSQTSINKDGFIQKELRLAKDIALEKSEGSVFLVPLRLDDCEVPKSLQFYQWANYFGNEQDQTYNKLLESLKLRLEDIKRKEVFAK